MSEAEFSLDAWCARVDYRGPVRATEDVLAAVQRAQLTAIPFENFDILLGRGISLEPAAICRKLLYSRRGGYCFELNSLYLMALEAIGFGARPLLARVHLGGQPSGRSHQLIHVALGGRPWITDVGFGGPALRAPIPLVLDEPRAQDGQSYRLTDAGPFGTMLQHQSEGQWRDLYSFDLGHVCPADIELGNHFTSTHPSSFFTFARIAALHTARGRVALLNRSLRRVESGVETLEEIPEGAGYLQALDAHFGIELGLPDAALPPLRSEDPPRK